VTTADEAGADEVAFLRAIIDWSAGQHGTWPDRTVVAGVSNGAFMAHWLALEASDQVAVLAAVAGGMPAACTTSSQPTRCPPCSSTGQPTQSRRSAAASPGTWDRTANCAAGRCRWTRRRAAGAPPTGARRTAPGSAGRGFTTHIIDGGGHTWPDGTAEEVRRFAGPLLGNAETRRIS
jgi:polyhydroxybutyrate depolymerase